MATTRDTDLRYTSASFPSSPNTISFTVANQPNRLLLVWINWLRQGTEITTVPTYAGVNLTLVGNYVMTSGPYGSLWRLTAPATGTNNLVITHNGSTYTADIVSYYNVDQTTPLGTVVSDVAFGPATSVSTSPSSAVGDIIARFLNKNGGTALAATGTSCTLRQSGDDADLDGISGFADQPAVAGTTTGGFSWTTNAGGVTVGVAVKAAAAGATLTCDTASFSLTGQATGLVGQKLLTADSQSYVLTGVAVTLTYSALSSHTLVCDVGTFVLTGITVGLFPQSLPGIYVLTGNDVNLLFSSRLLTSDVGSFTLIGQAVTFLPTRALQATESQFVLTGSNINLLYSNPGSGGGNLPALHKLGMIMLINKYWDMY